MANSAPHPCTQPGCGALVPRGQGRCDVHARKAEAIRGSAHARGYDSRWRAYRLTFLASHPLCVECQAQKPSRVTAATVVDHIRDHKGNATLMWDPSNHRSLCKKCHDRRVDAGDFGRDG